MRANETIFDGSNTPNFPSFSEGLSLREIFAKLKEEKYLKFPFLFGGTFIEGAGSTSAHLKHVAFPFLFGGTFIEGDETRAYPTICPIKFPFLFGGTFIEGFGDVRLGLHRHISLPFRRDFH